MNYKTLCIAVIVLIAVGAAGCNNSNSSQMPKHDHNAADDHHSETAQANDWGNTICPVMGDPVDKNIFTVYKDKKVYFCCEDCIVKFKKNPEKYIAILKKGAKEHHQGEKEHEHQH